MLGTDLDWRALFVGKISWAKNPLQDYDDLGLVTLVGIACVWAALSPPYVEIRADGFEMKGTFFWNRPEKYLFSDIRRFEDRYVTGRFSRRNGYWQTFAILRADAKAEVGLPVLNSGLFSRMKSALSRWQIAHGELEPTPFADMSDRVRF